MTKRTIILFAGLMIIFIISCGSYFYSECYKFNFTNKELIERIKTLKQDNPNLKVMGTNEKGECVEKIDKKDKIGMFYCISFQLRINLTVNCVINLSKSGSESSSIIQLTAVSFNKRRTQWKEINSNEISMRQNTKIIKMFETEILDKLGKWEHA